MSPKVVQNSDHGESALSYQQATAAAMGMVDTEMGMQGMSTGMGMQGTSVGMGMVDTDGEHRWGWGCRWRRGQRWGIER